jgi:hypothetical protein
MKNWLNSKLSADKIAESVAKPAPVATDANEVIELPRVCGMFDKPWIARYVRGERGLFRLMDTAKPDSSEVRGKGSAAAKDVTLKTSQITRDSEQERCPWCGVKGALILCEACSSWVCRSQVTERNGENYFRCRASCGSEGGLTPVTEGFKGHVAKTPSFGPALPAPKTGAEIGAGANRPRLKS